MRDLTIGVPRKGREPIILVDKASFEVATGERFGIVGESGSGKSMTLRAIAGLLPKGVKVLGGSIEFEGSDVLRMSKTARRNLMGPGIAMIFQEPMTALNPTMRVADQIAEGLRVHRGMPKAAARERAIDLMKRTGIPDAERRAAAFPHELSGGLRQRVMIALAVSCSPKVLLCDEPTTALDVTVQHQVLKLLEDLCDEFGTSLVFVTHDLAVVNQTCQRLAVMYAGRIVESGLVGDVFPAPRHPYTIGLLNSAPDFDKPDRELVPIPGFPPNLAAREPGCAFRPRCPFAIEACATTNPPLEWVEEGRAAACLRAGDIAKREVLA
ncbi:ABC transporter ATP-binding protein [Microbacterium sediminis]|uniref:ABC transporter ATP-binding protein n=1 Tax=Microbacterium sediminis TaxID=904291 RepID=UPI001969DA8C|nr:ABC transporter ATP-binding protein [Microbacterium sediminis]